MSPTQPLTPKGAFLRAVSPLGARGKRWMNRQLKYDITLICA